MLPVLLMATSAPATPATTAVLLLATVLKRPVSASTVATTTTISHWTSEE
jgi:hypothetical protein